MEASAELLDAWDALRESHAPLVARFYQARCCYSFPFRRFLFAPP